MVALVSTASSSNVSCVVSGKKKERKRRRGGWLAEPKWWTARAFELGCNAKEITGRGLIFILRLLLFN
jgi:hypothetical protein